jgi:hypothetical protein
MNRLANIWFLLIGIGSFPFAVALGSNEDFSILGWRIEGEEFEHGDLVFAIITGFALLMAFFKASRRWSAIRILKQKDKFQYVAPIRSERKKRLVLYTSIEVVFALILGSFFVYAAHESFYLGLVYFVIATEHVVHLLVGLKANLFAVGITKKAVIAADREARVMYLSGLLKISKHQQSLYFEYKKELVMHMPLNMIEDEEKFIAALKKVAPPNKIFYSGFEIENG